MSAVKKLPKIKIAFLHTAAQWPGVCGGEMSLSSVKVPGLEMHLDSDEQQLILECKGQRARMPLANIHLMVEEGGPVKA